MATRPMGYWRRYAIRMQQDYIAAGVPPAIARIWSTEQAVVRQNAETLVGRPAALSGDVHHAPDGRRRFTFDMNDVPVEKRSAVRATVAAWSGSPQH